MLRTETLNLLNSNNIDFKNIFSICIGKSFLYQSRFIDYLGNYERWNTDVKEGVLTLDNRLFNVEYIGTTSVSDNYWYSSELESVIPDEYVNLMINTRKIMESLNLHQFTEGKMELNNYVTGYNLSMIYIAFAPFNVAYFCGSGNASIYMFVKNLPDEIFRKMNSIEFSNCVMEIISAFDVNHKLMIKALLIENQIEYIDNQSNIVVKFNDSSIFTVEFNENDLLINISGNVGL